jgi:SAM-dependent methyltransferase
MTAPSPPESFQIPIEAAEMYESAFVPAFFAQWAPVLCELARVGPGMSVLDVACGTGIVARTAADLVGTTGRVEGVDLNEAMLHVARRVRPEIRWHQGDVVALPFPDGSFDAAVCQMAMMFFPDRRRALAQMARVVRPGGTVALVVPSPLEVQPAFRPFVDLAAGIAGSEARSLLTTYFVCGDLSALTSLVESVGLEVTDTRRVTGTYSAPSVDAAVSTEVESTPLVDRIDDETYARLRAGAHEVFAPWTAADGSVAAPFECLAVAATRR